MAIGIIAMLLSLLLPSLSKIRILALQKVCMGNVHGIVQAVNAYATNGLLSRGTTSGALPNTGPTESNWSDITTGNPGGLWLLVKHSGATPKMFFCPEAGLRRKYAKAVPDATSFSYDADTKVSTLSYSYLSAVGSHSYYPTGTTVQVTAPMRDLTTVNSTEFSYSLAIVADQNPRTEFNSDVIGPNDGENSKNHNGAGQNVGALDGTANWLITATTEDDDDIYAAEDGTSGSASRAEPGDAVLLP